MSPNHGGSDDDLDRGGDAACYSKPAADAMILAAFSVFETSPSATVPVSDGKTSGARHAAGYSSASLVLAPLLRSSSSEDLLDVRR